MLIPSARIAMRCVRSTLRSSAASTPPPFRLRHASIGARVLQRPISSTAVCMHGGQDHDDDFVPIGKAPGVPVVHASVASHDDNHGHDHADRHVHDVDSDDDSDDSDDEDDTVAVGPSGVEYGGPQRGGAFKEPTRFGDWERKGRCTDF